MGNGLQVTRDVHRLSCAVCFLGKRLGESSREDVGVVGVENAEGGGSGGSPSLLPIAPIALIALIAPIHPYLISAPPTARRTATTMDERLLFSPVRKT